MRKIVLAAVAALAVLFAGLTSIQTASANETGPDLGDWQFYTGLVCMADGAPEYNVTEIAQKWNLAVAPYLNPGPAYFGITAKNNCVTAGYPPSRRFTIDVIHDTSEPWCVYFGNQQLDADGRWTNNPYALINDKAGCVNVNHKISLAIGQIMGLRQLNSSGYDSRVMNNTTYSINNISYPDTHSGAAMATQYLTPWGGN